MTDDEHTRSAAKHASIGRSEGIKQIFPRIQARLTGFVYLMIFLAAPSGAASATPMKMAINLSCDLAVAFLLYALLKPVSRSLFLLAALFRFIFILLMAVTSLDYFGLTGLFQQSRSAAAFDAGYGIALVTVSVAADLTTIYDPAAQASTSTITAMNDARSAHSATLLLNSKVL